MATRYSDDEEGSPWSWILYLDERGPAEQHRALEEIWAGRVAGEQLEHFPWAWKPSHLLGVHPAQIELDHTPAPPVVQGPRRRHRPRLGPLRRRRDDHVRDPGPRTIRARRSSPASSSVDDAQLRFEYAGVCGYAATFDYGSG